MRKNTRTILVIIIVVLALAMYASVSIRINSGRNQLFKESYEQGNAAGLYSALFFKSPAIANRPYLGLAEAPLTIIVVVDFKSSLAEEFYCEKISEIEQMYVNTGQAKLYHKYYILREELEGKAGRFIYASASRCYNEFAFNRTIEFNKELFKADESSIQELAEKFSVPGNEFMACVKGSSFQSLYEDMLETEKFSIQSPSIYLGIDGQDYTVLLGNPEIELIMRRMKTKQIKVGI